MDGEKQMIKNKGYMLPLITLLSGLILTFFYYLLNDKILETKRKKEMKIYKQFFPKGKTFSKATYKLTIKEDSQKITVYSSTHPQKIVPFLSKEEIQKPILLEKIMETGIVFNNKIYLKTFLSLPYINNIVSKIESLEKEEKDELYSEPIQLMILQLDHPDFMVVKNKEKELIGFILKTSDSKGYGGSIKYLLALNTKWEVIDFRMVEHQETPGLGTKADEEKFRNGFKGLIPLSKNMPTEKKEFREKLELDAISGATITSMATVRALAKAADKHIIWLYEEMDQALYQKYIKFREDFPLSRLEKRYLQFSLGGQK